MVAVIFAERAPDRVIILHTPSRLPSILELTGTMQESFIASKQSNIADARRQSHVAAFEELKCSAYDIDCCLLDSVICCFKVCAMCRINKGALGVTLHHERTFDNCSSVHNSSSVT